MRLIDANTLPISKGFFVDEAGFGANFYVVHKADIDNAPTINALVLPCKLGDTVWGIRKFTQGLKIMSGIVHQMYFGDNMELCICVKGVCKGLWGEKVFATKEEAIAKLGGDNNG